MIQIPEKVGLGLAPAVTCENEDASTWGLLIEAVLRGEFDSEVPKE
jgi:hypothetical protein